MLSERVCAIVVTYNRKDLLRICLDALHVQTQLVADILVVDNASTDGTKQMLVEQFPHVQVLSLSHNGGGAGGFHAGIEWAYQRDFDWLWLMDDDGRPAPDCLSRLLEQQQPHSVLVPIQQDSRGDCYGICEWQGTNVNVTYEVIAQKRPYIGPYVFAFVGPLVPRTVVQQVGLPNKDFFIWYDDIEYALRIIAKPTMAIRVVPDAVFFHDFGGSVKVVRFLGRTSIRPQQPAWKGYYGARNPLYIITRLRYNFPDLARYSITQIRLIIGDILYEADRGQRVKLRLRGIMDGLLGRLGKRV